VDQGGYFATARKVLEQLGFGIKQEGLVDEDNWRMEWPINDWLATVTGWLNVKAATMSWSPGSDNPL
jgi:hypothetical protein